MWCGTLTEPQLAHLDRVAALAEICVRRLSRLERENLRFGNAIFFSSYSIIKSGCMHKDRCSDPRRIGNKSLCTALYKQTSLDSLKEFLAEHLL